MVSSVAADVDFAAVADQPALPEKSDKLVSLQVLRALAALGVTAFHLKPFFAIKLGLRDVLPGFLSVGAAGVHLFFVISGFVIVYSSTKLLGRPGASRDFFIRRCIRVVPLYWGLSLILLTHTLLVYGGVGWQRLVTSFAFIPAPRSGGLTIPLLIVGWTLNYEMFFYAMFALGLLALRHFVVAGVSAFFVGVVVLSLAAGPFPQPLAFWTSAVILEFVAGMLLASAYRSGVALSRPMSMALIAVALIAFAASAYGSGPLPRGILWAFAAVLMVAGAVLGPQLDARRGVWKLLGLIGGASYALYLIHPFAFEIPLWGLPRLLTPSANLALYAILVLISAVLAAIALHLCVEKPVTVALTRLWVREATPEWRPAADGRRAG